MLGTKRLPRDSILVHIPHHVTADLGVALKRTRKKRLSQFKALNPNLDLFESAAKKKSDLLRGRQDDSPIEGGKRGSGDDSDVDSEKVFSGPEGQEHTGKPPYIQKHQFGSIIDYLEAKYVKGVMIDDLDERVREHKKQKSTSTIADKGDDLSVLSDSVAGSCYSQESFIDDTELRTEVAHQILGSSIYGTTKIEAEAVAEGDEDHAFFVNIGDLEMEDGWDEDQLDEEEDWMKQLKKKKG
jgi:hypothetical protein